MLESGSILWNLEMTQSFLKMNVHRLITLAWLLQVCKKSKIHVLTRSGNMFGRCCEKYVLWVKRHPSFAGLLALVSVDSGFRFIWEVILQILWSQNSRDNSFYAVQTEFLSASVPQGLQWPRIAFNTAFIFFQTVFWSRTNPYELLFLFLLKPWNQSLGFNIGWFHMCNDERQRIVSGRI